MATAIEYDSDMSGGAPLGPTPKCPTCGRAQHSSALGGGSVCRSMDPDAVYFVAWTGRYTTTLFTLDSEALARLL
jgi:hypothetical protein